jgi:hypothetical protein
MSYVIKVINLSHFFEQMDLFRIISTISVKLKNWVFGGQGFDISPMYIALLDVILNGIA